MSEITPVNQNVMDMDTLCQNAIGLIRYARGLAVNHINSIELMTMYFSLRLLTLKAAFPLVENARLLWYSKAVRRE